MCGRYTLYTQEDELATLFDAKPLPITERFNISPTQEVPVLTERAGGAHELSFMRWGLIPHWVKAPDEFRSTLFNARSETAADKPSFRDAMRKNRCIMPASGFYEWKAEGSAKQPYYIRRRDGQPMAFAGLYSAWTKGTPALMSSTILTTDATGPMTELHHRTPVILEPENWERWLDPDELDPTAVEDLLTAPAEDVLEWYPVDRRVGNSRAEGRELIAPLR